VRLERIVPGERPPAGLVGAVLTRDLAIAGVRWSKGRVLSSADLDAVAVAGSPDAAAAGENRRRDRRGVTVICPDPGEMHEDVAGLRLAEAVRGEDDALLVRGPAQSRVDLVAAVAGVVGVRIATLERLNRIDPLEVFTVYDGQVVAPGDLVASVKVGPHVVAEAVVAEGERIAGRGGPVVRVRPFRPVRVAVVVKESIDGAARTRFEASARAKVEGLGGTLASIVYVADRTDAVVEAFEAALDGPAPAGLILTAGGASTDPADPFYVAVGHLGGRVVRHGVPSHPGSMVWLGRLGPAAVVGLPSCGAFSKATAADLLLPRLVAGEPPTAATVARLGHGGVLTRSQRFRFPAYARELDAPDG
jgi:molybdenum cofactor cytidylyltransferase